MNVSINHVTLLSRVDVSWAANLIVLGKDAKHHIIPILISRDSIEKLHSVGVTITHRGTGANAKR
jgi:hypothetical protein